MSTIRPLQEKDLPQVISLFELEMGSGTRNAPPGMEAHFRTLFLDGPWVDPEIPALVFEGQDGRIGGVIGSNVRKMKFKGESIRLAASGPLFVEPQQRTLAAFLLRRYFSGPQELTMTDRQSLAAQTLFVKLGGEIAHLQCLRWTHIFKPYTFKGYHLQYVPRLSGLWPRLRPATEALDTLNAALPHRRSVSAPNLQEEVLTPNALVTNLEAVTKGLDLYPDYEEGYVAWALGELAKRTHKGTLTSVLVRDPKGRVIGWYIYYLNAGGLCEVFQIAAARGKIDDVLDHLFFHARRGGAAALRGRVEPDLRESLRHRNVSFSQQACLIIHSKNPEYLRAVTSGKALMSFLEGAVFTRETFIPPEPNT